MRKLVVVACAFCAFAVSAAAHAQTPTQDSVTGVGVTIRPDNGFVSGFDITASSGPSGENPTGTVTFSQGRFVFLGGPVTCLAVHDNVATLNFDSGGGAIDTLEVTDSPSGDVIRAAQTGRAPGDCSPLTGSAIELDVTSGDITVIDAPPLPTSKDQCKNGGWRNFGSTFKTEGDCVSYVATKGKNRPNDH
jgi:hypothetical protein